MKLKWRREYQVLAEFDTDDECFDAIEQMEEKPDAIMVSLAMRKHMFDMSPNPFKDTCSPGGIVEGVVVTTYDSRKHGKIYFDSDVLYNGNKYVLVRYTDGVDAE